MLVCSVCSSQDELCVQKNVQYTQKSHFIYTLWGKQCWYVTVQQFMDWYCLPVLTLHLKPHMLDHQCWYLCNHSALWAGTSYTCWYCTCMVCCAWSFEHPLNVNCGIQEPVMNVSNYHTLLHYFLPIPYNAGSLQAWGRGATSFQWGGGIWSSVWQELNWNVKCKCWEVYLCVGTALTPF